MARISRQLGVRNPLNTAFLPMQDRMLLTYDAGRPYEIDTESLEVITPGLRTQISSLRSFTRPCTSTPA